MHSRNIHGIPYIQLVSKAKRQERELREKYGMECIYQYECDWNERKKRIGSAENVFLNTYEDLFVKIPFRPRQARYLPGCLRS